MPHLKDFSLRKTLLTQFMQTPRNIHLDCAKRVLRYVSGTMNYDILYKLATLIRLSGYANAHWASYKTNGRSTSGFVFSPGNRATLWSNKKQLSITKAKYSGAVVATCEAVGLKRVLKDLNVSIADPILLYCDSLINLHLARNLVFHAQTKHIKVHYHFI